MARISPQDEAANRAMAEAVLAQRRLQACRDIAELRAQASIEACAFCGFDRAVVLTVEDGVLRAAGNAVDHEACDLLRRTALATPTPLESGSDEAELVRRADDGRRTGTRGASVLQQALGLEQFVLAPIVPETRTVALLVVDRHEPEVALEERVRVEVYAGLIGVALERAVLRARLAELSAEFRHLATSAMAMGQEALLSPVTMSTDLGWGAVFPRSDLRSPAAAWPAGVAAPGGPAAELTSREVEIMELLVLGRSNRVIAAELHLSPETVKSHVARLLRKLGATNRAEAVGRYLAALQGADVS
ncbi:helix-turn-helix transcriptional regulator [Conexibacter sp. SYSU D00693]|uniref:helix-turn-helix transcriptional regulator n=1 Tax=Conexibacter sp. SYSU D00693 TaxID=2812560 RepID=UPI00196BABDE|nr:helix-turn-helix transcriptional regulator [Conexibacter sp. SYSU D00693]